MSRAVFLCLLVSLPLAAQEAPIPTATALPSSPFFIKKTWPVGGNGNWDYLTIDPTAQRLYIAHGHAVQVVDIESGEVAGEITGFREAHAIALDDIGSFGYVSDGPADAVAVFDRRSLAIQATVAIGCSPRSIAFEPRNRLVFAVCGASLSVPGRPSQTAASAASGSAEQPQHPHLPAYTGPSHVVVIDTVRNAPIADIILDGDLRFAQPDANGRVYITAATAIAPRVDRNGNVHTEIVPPRIARIDASGIADEVRRRTAGHSDADSDDPVTFDWSGIRRSSGLFLTIPLPPSCAHPQGLAVDGRDLRIFAACDNQQLLVLDASHGQIVAALVTGPGDDVIGYDADRGLIYSANGGGYGSLTIVRQDANTDSYAVIQNLATMERARTLAVDSSTGQVYLVTDIHGAGLSDSGGIGTLHFDPIQNSFQVLVVGH